MDDPLTVNATEHRFDFGFAHSRLPGTERVCSVPLPTAGGFLFSGSYSKIHDSFLAPSEGGPEDQDTHPSDRPSSQP